MEITQSLPPEECVQRFLVQAQRLGITVQWQNPGQFKFDAAYFAAPGSPGHIVLAERNPRPGPVKVCTLLSHEMVHVLQHWKGNLNSLEPLGWPRNGAAVGEHRWAQEQEAYTAQNQPSKVLSAVMKLRPVSSHVSP